MDKLATTKQTSNLETFFKLRLDLIKVSGEFCAKKEGQQALETRKVVAILTIHFAI